MDELYFVQKFQNLMFEEDGGETSGGEIFIVKGLKILENAQTVQAKTIIKYKEYNIFFYTAAYIE